jgi:DNA-binding CsgD family transcriptional regulator
MKTGGRAPSRLKILDFLAFCGQERDLQGMFRRVIAELPRLIPYDQSFAILGDLLSFPGATAVPTVSVGIPEMVKRAYLSYYYKCDVVHARLREALPMPARYFLVDWHDRIFEQNEFATDFVMKLAHIDVCAGIPFFNSIAHPTSVTAVFELTRSKNARFSGSEELTLRLIQPHLTNYVEMLQRLETYPQHDYTAAEMADKCRLLSKREAEIASYLLNRLRPVEIATILMISLRTVERHIENIYAKLGVRNRKEMLARLLK